MTDPQELEDLAVSVEQAVHDLNNFCTSLLGFAELAQLGLPLGSCEHGYLTEVADSGRSAIALGDRLCRIAADLRRIGLA